MIGSSLLSAGIGLLNGSKQAKIAKQGLAMQQQQYQKLEDAAAPQLAAGKVALDNLSDPQANFTTSPGYDFRLKTGQQSVLGSKALNGLLRSGAAVKALDNYSQGAASDEYGKWVGQQQAQAGLYSQGVNSLAGGVAGQSAAANNYTADKSNVTNSNYDALGQGIGGLISNPTVSSGLNSLLASAKKAMAPSAVAGGSSYTMPAYAGASA